MPLHIHITGAPGAGKTTIGEALAEVNKIRHIDADDFKWEAAHLPCSVKTSEKCRQQALAEELGKEESWVLSGSIHYWGEIFTNQFNLVVLVVTPVKIRLSRLTIRERIKYGCRIEEKGDMRDIHTKFMKKAELYDKGGLEVRSLNRDRDWLNNLWCQVLMIDGSKKINDNLSIMNNAVKNI